MLTSPLNASVSPQMWYVTPGSPHKCQLWALLYNSAESGVILPALPTSILKEEGEAETHPGLPKSPQAGPPSPAPHQVNGTVSPRQVQVHESIGLGQETVEGLGRKGRGATGKGVIEPLYPQATRQRPPGAEARVRFCRGFRLHSGDSHWTRLW